MGSVNLFKSILFLCICSFFNFKLFIKMKFMMTFLAAAALLFTGCDYEVPLAKEPKSLIDPALLGLWVAIPDEGAVAEEDERILILRFSDTEYLIHYPVNGADETYYRCYPIKIGGVSCVQIEAIGTNKGHIPKDVKNIFEVASYRIENAELEIKLLNNDLVDGSLKTTEALKQSFLKHTSNIELFNDPGRFRRAEK
ncbi:MAG: hypothetical protein CMI16_04095 [Opitutaceae bacterium]|nr:hypothetical protein [Opitutaceae bacterium]|tara:strand:+ start:1714 stop:2304 length:591 start_codon:yes stop_codon:yes gene_type:complete